MTPFDASKHVPSRYQEGRFYPVPGTVWGVARTRGRGRQAGRSYVTLRRKRWLWLHLVSSSGEVLKERFSWEWQRFRACLSDDSPAWQSLDDGARLGRQRLEVLPSVEIG